MSDYVEVYDNCLSPHGEDFQIYEENLNPITGERIEGWLRVFEDSLDLMTRSGHGHVRFASDHPLPWHGGFCVARTDERSMICYKDEQSANRVGRRLPRTRLDGGIRSFLRHWKQPSSDYEDGSITSSSSSSNRSNYSSNNYQSKTLSRLRPLREEGNFVTDYVPQNRYDTSHYGTVYRTHTVGGYRNPAYYGSPAPTSKYSSPMDSHHFFTMRPGQYIGWNEQYGLCKEMP